MPSGTLRSGSVLGNPSGSEAPVIDATMSQMLNQTISASPTWTGTNAFTGTTTIKGTTTNDSAAAGYIGEYIEAILTFATGSALTNNTPITVAQITLTPGDWDVTGSIHYNGAATTIVGLISAGLSDTAATLQTTPPSRIAQTGYQTSGANLFASGSVTQLVGPTRWSVASNTIVYLVGKLVFATSTAQLYGGHLWARRRR